MPALVCACLACWTLSLPPFLSHSLPTLLSSHSSFRCQLKGHLLQEVLLTSVQVRFSLVGLIALGCLFPYILYILITA